MVNVGSKVRLVHQNFDLATHSHNVVNEILRLGGVDGVVVGITSLGGNAIVQLEEPLDSLDGRSIILVSLNELEEIVDNSEEDVISLPKAIDKRNPVLAIDLNGYHVGETVALDTSDAGDDDTYTSLIIGTLKCVHHLERTHGTPYVAVTIEGRGGWSVDLNLTIDQEVWV